jgi:hypothetical protein
VLLRRHTRITQDDSLLRDDLFVFHKDEVGEGVDVDAVDSDEGVDVLLLEVDDWAGED